MGSSTPVTLIPGNGSSLNAPAALVNRMKVAEIRSRPFAGRRWLLMDSSGCPVWGDRARTHISAVRGAYGAKNDRICERTDVAARVDVTMRPVILSAGAVGRGSG